MAHHCKYGRNGQKTTNLVSFDASHQAEANGLGIKAVRPILIKVCAEIFPIFLNLSRYNMIQKLQKIGLGVCPRIGPIKVCGSNKSM